MDLKHLEDQPSPGEREAIDHAIGARLGRDRLLPALHAARDRVGYVSRGALAHVARALSLPPAEVYAVASFYAHLPTNPTPPRTVHVCVDLACGLAGGRAALTVDAPPDARVAESPCLGLCDRAPAALFDEAGARPVKVPMPRVSPAEVARALHAGPPPSPPESELRRRGPLLARATDGPVLTLAEYRRRGGLVALEKARAAGPERVLRELKDAGLFGRGGAGFPTARKWEAVARALGRPRYVVANADESEPGTFKDRALLENDPFALLEAMAIAGHTVGADRGFVYLRAEYPVVEARLSAAIAEAERHGIFPGFAIELYRGAGAYVCGEETALCASIEGHRGEPRNKPPFPVEAGLFGRPTVINNVETLIAALSIVEGGAARYRALGTQDSPGTRLFSVSGAVERPGVYELPHGTPLAELLREAGATPTLRAVLLGGAAGGFATPAELDVPLSSEGCRARGLTLGSGVVFVLDERADLGAVLGRLAAFFRDESCGQCVPCRVGTMRQEELIERLRAGRPLGSWAEERGRLSALGQVMRDASICGLGQTASSAIESAVAKLAPFGGTDG